MNSPVLPLFCRICMTGMIAGTVVSASADSLSMWLRSGRLSNNAIRNSADSAFFTWLLFGIPLIVGCIIQLRQGFDHLWYDAHSLTRTGRPRMPWARKCRAWMATAIAGAAILGALCVAVRLLC